MGLRTGHRGDGCFATFSWIVESRSSLPPDLPLCGVRGAPMAPLRVPPSSAEADGVPGATTGVRVIELAIETDYEYFSLHEDA